MQYFSKEKIGQLDDLIKKNDLHHSGNASEAQIRAHSYVNSAHTMQYLHTLMQQAHTKIACALREGKKGRIPSDLAHIQARHICRPPCHIRTYANADGQ